MRSWHVTWLVAAASCAFQPDWSRFPPCGDDDACGPGARCWLTERRCVPECGGDDAWACVIDGGARDGGQADGGGSVDGGAVDGGLRLVGALPEGIEGTSVTYGFSATGGIPPFRFALVSAPAGVAMSTSGLLSWLMPVAGTHPVRVSVIDAATPAGADTADFTLRIATRLRWLSASRLDDLPPGAQGLATFDAVGGTPPYSATFEAGQVPPGMMVNTNPPRLFGTPTTAGAYRFTVRLTDSHQPPQSSAQTFDVDVVRGDGGLSMATRALPSGQVGHPFDARLQALGGSPPYQWLTADGGIPGVSIVDDVDAGRLGGTPTSAGTHTLTLELADSAGQRVTRSFSSVVY